MNFQLDVIRPAFSIVHVLANEKLTGPEKLELLTDEVAKPLEALDDAIVGFLPPVIREIAHFLVDNPVSDGLERSLIARPIAELIYQAHLAVSAVIDTTNVFVQRVVLPAKALILELTNLAIPGAEKRARLQTLIKSFLSGVTGLVEFLPAGLSMFLTALLGTKFAQDALEWVSAFIGEGLYQILSVIA